MLTTILFIIDFILTGFATLYIWNNVVAVVFGIMPITFWQGYIVSFAISYFLPKFRIKNQEYDEHLLYDIVYTLTIWGICALGVNFVGF